MDPRLTALARPRNDCTSKLQNYPLLREDAQHQETHNCQTEEKFGHKFQMGARQQDTLAE
jgi:hypothetical protein